MKKTILILIAIIGISQLKAQTYISYAHGLTNTAGTLAEKSNVSIEVGKQWDVFSLGLDLGKTTLSKMSGKDTSTYIEIRPNLNIFQQGKWTNTFTAGIGYIFGAQENLLTELTSGIEYSASETVHINVQFGQYYYSGLHAADNSTFLGASVMYYLKPSKKKALINK